MASERRKTPRTWPKEDILAVFAPTPTLARVKDISRTGLGLEYLSGPSQERDWKQISLFVTGGKLYIPGLPFRLIHHEESVGEEPALGHLSRWICGLEFGEMTRLQAFQLDSVLALHTLGQPEPPPRR